jgi:hypothetical protein
VVSTTLCTKLQTSINTMPNPLDEAGSAPTLDDFYKREPESLTDAELNQIVALHRDERDAYDEKERKKAEKKEAKG